MEKRIRKMNHTQWCCIYNTETGLFTEIYDEIFKMEDDIGFYTKVGTTVVGVANHFRGPVLFIDNQRYFLKELNYELVHTHLPNSQGQFQLIVDGKEKESLIYIKPEFIPSFFWGDTEEDCDFFQWLCQSEKSREAKDRFHDFYTQREMGYYQETTEEAWQEVRKQFPNRTKTNKTNSGSLKKQGLFSKLFKR